MILKIGICGINKINLCILREKESGNFKCLFYYISIFYKSLFSGAIVSMSDINSVVETINLSQLV